MAQLTDHLKRYNRLTDDEKTAALSKVIIRMLRLYVCDTLLEWNAEAADGFLTGSSWIVEKDVDSDRVQNDNSSGESTRSKNASQEGVRSEEPLTKSEVRTLYVFAEKLYAVGSGMKIKIRLKLRYGM